MSNATTSRSRFGALAIARVEKDVNELKLTVIDRGPFDTKQDCIEEIDKKLHNGEGENRLVLIRLNGFFESQTQEIMQPVTVTNVVEIDEDGDPLPGEEGFEEPEAAAAE